MRFTLISIVLLVLADGPVSLPIASDDAHPIDKRWCGSSRAGFSYHSESIWARPVVAIDKLVIDRTRAAWPQILAQLRLVGPGFTDTLKFGEPDSTGASFRHAFNQRRIDLIERDDWSPFQRNDLQRMIDEIKNLVGADSTDQAP